MRRFGEARTRGGGFALGPRLAEEANSGVTRFVQRVKHSMPYLLVIMVYGILEMTNKIEEQDFGVCMERWSKCRVLIENVSC
jgi:hypothetical protein